MINKKDAIATSSADMVRQIVTAAGAPTTTSADRINRYAAEAERLSTESSVHFEYPSASDHP